MAKQSLTHIEEKFLILKAIEPHALELAYIRSQLVDMLYIEVDNTFIISCSRSFKDSFPRKLRDFEVNFISIYANNKTGAAVESSGINDADQSNLEKIILSGKS